MNLTAWEHSSRQGSLGEAGMLAPNDALGCDQSAARRGASYRHTLHDNMLRPGRCSEVLREFRPSFSCAWRSVCLREGTKTPCLNRPWPLREPFWCHVEVLCTVKTTKCDGRLSGVLMRLKSLHWPAQLCFRVWPVRHINAFLKRIQSGTNLP